jgi:hypothetical protein
VEEEDPGPAWVTGKKPAGYRNPFFHRHQKIKCTLRTRGSIPPGVKEERYERRLVNLGIIGHESSLYAPYSLKSQAVRNMLINPVENSRFKFEAPNSKFYSF